LATGPKARFRSNDIQGGLRHRVGVCLLGLPLGAYLRPAHREALGLDEFLTVALIGISYGAALLWHAYGVLAVSAAGLAMRRIKADRSSDRTAEPVRTPKHRRRILTSGTGARRSSHGHTRCSISMSNGANWRSRCCRDDWSHAVLGASDARGAMVLCLCYSSLSGRCRLAFTLTFVTISLCTTSP
jgi:hypothetical protein